MSKSQIACAFDAASTTVVRVKTVGTSSFVLTMCCTINGGLDELCGPRGMRLADKIVFLLREWRNEPVSLTFSPPEILTLPAWFPQDTPADHCDNLCRIEAGYFLNNVDTWQWHDITLKRCPELPDNLEKKLIMFYPAAPTRFIEQVLQRHYDAGSSGIHIEAVARLSASTGKALQILEIEDRYVTIYHSVDGKICYFRYWPVKYPNEREYFAMTALATAPQRNGPVLATGSAASAMVLERISCGTSSPIQPLELHPLVSEAKGAGKGKSTTATIRAISAAIMALS